MVIPLIVGNFNREHTGISYISWENDDSRADLGVTTLSADKPTYSRFHRRTARTFRQWCHQWESSSEERHSAFVACDVLWCSLGVHKLPESPVGSLGSALPSRITRIISPHSIMDHGSSRIIMDHHGSWSGWQRALYSRSADLFLSLRSQALSSWSHVKSCEVMCTQWKPQNLHEISWDVMRCYESPPSRERWAIRSTFVAALGIKHCKDGWILAGPTISRRLPAGWQVTCKIFMSWISLWVGSCIML